MEEIILKYIKEFLMQGGVGGALGLLLSLVVLGLFAVIATKLYWPKKSQPGKVTRILFIVYCFIMIPASAGFTGFCWGIMNAAKKEIASEKIQETIALPISRGIANLYVRSQQVAEGRDVSEAEFEQELNVFLEKGGEIDVEQLESSVHWVTENIDQIERIVVAGMKEEVGATEDGAFVTKFVGSILEERIAEKGDSIQEEIKSIVPKLMESVGNGDSVITCDEVSQQITSSYVEPQMEAQLNSYTFSFLVWSVLGLLGTFFIPFAIIHVIFLFVKSDEQ